MKPIRNWFENGGKLRETALAIVGSIAVAGAGFAIIDLYHAIRQAEELYSVGMAGLSIEADLQDYTQESRRIFVYALTTADPNVQLPYVNAARAADKQVIRLYRAFSQVRLNAAARKQLDQLVLDWNAYLGARDEIIGHILEDRSDLALKQEQTQGAPQFERCARHLQTLKRLLDAYAREQLAAVRRTYYRCAGEVCFLIVTTALFIVSVRLLTGLRKRNQKLTESELLERQRSEILECISANLPLDNVFAAIADMVERRLASAECIITAADLASGVNPGERQQSAASRHNNTAEPAGHGLKSAEGSWSIPICGGHRRLLGRLEVRFNARCPRGPEDRKFVERSAQLAALAIEHRLVNDQLAFQAQHDSLTGLPNRIMLQDRLDRTIARSANGELGFCVLWIDLDKFKQVNDALGHQVGDILLQQVAHRLRQSVSAAATVARIGGDEFVILLPDHDRESGAQDTARTILTRLGEPVTASGHQISVGASIGIAVYPDHGQDRETLLRNADTAMYRVKFQGKNMYRVYDPEMGAISAETLEIDRQLRVALQEQQFFLHYQPQVTAEGQIEGVEALVRWNSPTLGAISPARFIPLAEENGLIVPLGEWVLREACRQGAEWHRSGFQDLRIAVNVSAHQFVRSDFAEVVASALRDTGFPPEQLELELTETAVMRAPEESIPQFQKLRRLGIRISIDDFGTGNSSLNYLLQLPVDALKIDRSFVDALGRSGRDSLLLVRAIIGMAHGCRLQVVAEGIETADQLRIVHGEGCDLSQGYLLHRPLSADALTSLLCRDCGNPAAQMEIASKDLMAIAGILPGCLATPGAENTYSI